VATSTHAETPTRAFIASLLVEEESLFRLLLVERVLVPLVLLVWMAVAGASRAHVSIAAAFFIWELATSVAMRSQLALLKKHPHALLSIEAAVCVVAFLSLGPWRGAFYSTLASPIVFAAVFVGTGLALVFAALMSIVVIVAVGVLHMADGRGPDDATTAQDWGGAPLLFFAAALLISLIRQLLDGVAVLGERAAAGEADLARARQAVADEQARRAITRTFHDDVRQALTAIPARWKVLATLPALAANADGLRNAAAVAESGGADVKEIVLATRPASTEATQDVPVTEGDDVLAELADKERLYFKGVIVARLVMAVLIAAFVVDARDSRFVAVTLMWLALLIWVIVTSICWRQLFARLKTQPSLLWIEEGVAVALLWFGTTSYGSAFWLVGATAPVLATAVGTMQQAAALTLASSAAVAVSIFAADTFWWQSSPSASGALAATVGYVGPVLPAIYVRFLLDRLGADARDMRARAEETERLRRELAFEETRRAATPPLLAKVRPVVEELKRQLALAPTDNNLVAAEKERLGELERSLDRLEADTASFHFNEPARFLDEVIEQATSGVKSLGGQVILEGRPPHVALEAPRPEALTGLLREALTNAHKYGEPPIRVHIERAHSSIKVLVTDSGAGFDVAAEVAREGLWVLRHFGRLAGVAIQVDSDGNGTRVCVEFDV
jgi:signal transduction histidine kinase